MIVMGASDLCAKNLAPLFESNPLTLAEQKCKIKAFLAAKPEKMVYSPRRGEEKNGCARKMLQNALQMELIRDKDIMAVADHRINLLKAVGQCDGSKKLYDNDTFDYEDEAIAWFCDEIFFPGALQEVKIEDKPKFIELYTTYSNSAKATF